MRTLVIILVGALMQSRAAAQVSNWDSVATTVVQRMALQRGERVLLVAGANPVTDAIVPRLRAGIRRTGAVDLGVLDVEGRTVGESTPFTRSVEGRPRADLRQLFDSVDVGVMLPGVNAGHPPYSAMLDVLHAGRGRTVHFHWAGAYDTRGVAIDVDDRISSFYERALLDTDYPALAGIQQAFESAARSGEIRVTTPAGTDLRFRIGDRPVTRQDGDASAARAARARNVIDRETELPAGAIRVAPVESTVNGTIAFPDAPWSSRPVRGLRMTFRDGRMTAYEATEGHDAVDEELRSAGDAARSFREFALGFNPRLAMPEDRSWIPYYGYGAGVVRLSLGDNSELGGAVRGNYVRWNFFTDATVTVNGEAWVRQGRLVRRPR